MLLLLFQDAIVQDVATGENVSHVLTFAEVGKNMLVAGISCFLILLLTAWRRVGGDDFNFIGWMRANANRWIMGAVVLTLISALSFLVPSLSDFMDQLGFNFNAKVPLSLGIGLAALLATATKAKEPKAIDEDSDGEN